MLTIKFTQGKVFILVRRKRDRERSEKVDLIKDYCASLFADTRKEVPRHRDGGKNGKSNNKVDSRKAKVASRCGTLQDRPRKNFAPRRFHSLPLGFREHPPCGCVEASTISMEHYHHHRRRRRRHHRYHRRRRHHLLLFFVFFLSRLRRPPSQHPSVPRRRNMAPRQEIRPSTPLLSQQPRVARFLRHPRPPVPSPLFPGYFPSSLSLSLSLSPPRVFPPSSGVPVPPPLHFKSKPRR